MLPTKKHAWWTYQFELLPMQMPLWMPVAKVKALVASHFAQQVSGYLFH
jgi:hypothetical protein